MPVLSREPAVYFKCYSLGDIGGCGARRAWRRRRERAARESHYREGHGEDALVVLAVGGEKGRKGCVRGEDGGGRGVMEWDRVTVGGVVVVVGGGGGGLFDEVRKIPIYSYVPCYVEVWVEVPDNGRVSPECRPMPVFSREPVVYVECHFLGDIGGCGARRAWRRRRERAGRERFCAMALRAAAKKGNHHVIVQ